MQHTFGVWVAEEYNMKPYWQVYSKGGTVPLRIANIEDGPNVEANAKLVAAAPDLLKALKDLLEWGRDHTSPIDPNSPHQLLVQACNAVIKATGSC